MNLLKENHDMRQRHRQKIRDVLHEYEGEIEEDPREIRITTIKGNGFRATSMGPVHTLICVEYPDKYHKHYVLGYVAEGLEGTLREERWKQYTPINEFDYLIEDLNFYLEKGNFRKK